MGLSSSRRLQVTLFAIPLSCSLWAPFAQAQTCPYAILRLESSRTVDATTICQAAKPWSDQGYEVLVYLTDERPDTEDDWYALLDQVEADVGLRNLSLPDSFKKNGLSLAAQTAAPDYEVSVTYGEGLYNTPIDTSSKFEEIKQNIRAKLSRGNAEEALSYGLQDMYMLNHAAESMPTTAAESSSTRPQPLAQAPVSSPPVYQEPATDPWAGMRTGAGLLTSAGLGIGIWQRRRQQKLEQQRQQLQERIATLLMACNDLLIGNSSTDTILYDLFEAARGRLYPELEKQAIAWLTQARQALDQAFIVQDELQQEEPKWLRNKHVQSWEELYLALIGDKLYHEKLTDEELRVALDPMQTLATYRWENQLAAPLKKIQQRLAETPLSIELITMKATAGRSLGILGTLQQVKEQIERLRKSETEAPQELKATRIYRQTIASEFPEGLSLSAEKALQGLDKFLEDADVALQKERFLDTLLQCELAQNGLNWLRDYGDAIATYRQHQTDIQTILTEGFRPPQQANHQSALAACLEAGQQTIAAGDYSTIPDHLAELERLDKAALYHAQQWQQLCYDNRQQIEILSDEYTQLQADCDGAAAKTWNTLQTYPAENWQMVENCLPTARKTLAIVHQQDLPTAAHLNSLNQQSFYEARDRLEVASNNISVVKQQLAQQQQQAELVEKMSLMLTNLIDSLGAHARAINKVGQGGLLGLFSGMEPRLRQALERLPEAVPHIQQRCYMSALAIHDQAGRTMLTVYREKLDAIAAQVNGLINHRDARNNGRFDYDFALKRIPSSTDIATASNEEIHKLYSDLTQAWERLKTARSSAKAEIRRQEQRRRQQRSHRASSSSSSSYHSSSSSSRRSSSGSSRRSSSSGSSRRSSSSHGSSRRR